MALSFTRQARPSVPRCGSFLSSHGHARQSPGGKKCSYRKEQEVSTPPCQGGTGTGDGESFVLVNTLPGQVRSVQGSRASSLPRPGFCQSPPVPQGAGCWPVPTSGPLHLLCQLPSLLSPGHLCFGVLQAGHAAS